MMKNSLCRNTRPRGLGAGVSLSVYRERGEVSRYARIHVFLQVPPATIRPLTLGYLTGAWAKQRSLLLYRLSLVWHPCLAHTLPSPKSLDGLGAALIARPFSVSDDMSMGLLNRASRQNNAGEADEIPYHEGYSQREPFGNRNWD